MSESKVDLNERKIRNGLRKQKEALQKQLWDKLKTTYKVKVDFFYYSGMKIDKIIINETVRKK